MSTENLAENNSSCHMTEFLSFGLPEMSTYRNYKFQQQFQQGLKTEYNSDLNFTKACQNESFRMGIGDSHESRLSHECTTAKFNI